MYVLKHGIKKDPVRRWALPDRIFFGHGACPILAGAYLKRPPLAGFHAEKIVPAEDFAGNHIYVTNGVLAFDYHGYSLPRPAARRITGRAGRAGYAGWDCTIETVDFDLLDTADLNQRKMLGPDQYLHDPVARADRFIERIDHAEASRQGDAADGLANAERTEEISPALRQAEPKAIAVWRAFAYIAANSHYRS